MERINVTCRLAADDVAFLDKLADAMERDRSYLIKKAVAEYIALHRWQVDEVEKALADAEAGDVATDKQVKATFAELRGWKFAGSMEHCARFALPMPTLPWMIRGPHNERPPESRRQLHG